MVPSQDSKSTVDGFLISKAEKHRGAASVPQETGSVPPRGSHSLSVDQSGRCMLNTIDGPSESVEDYLCDPEEMPLGARESRLPCPEDCVLNDWGTWSRCSLVSPEQQLEVEVEVQLEGRSSTETH